MKRHRMRRLLALAVASVCIVACDDGTEPGTIGDFDPAAVAAAVDVALAPIDASLDPSYVLSSFMYSVLSAPAGQGVTADPPSLRGATLLLAGPVSALSLARGAVIAADVDIAADLRGSTFVWSIAQEGWVVDPDATGAPQEGVRITWYATDDVGDFTLPLDVLGRIDLTELDANGLDRFGVLIVDTRDGAATTLADYVYGYSLDRTGDEYTEHAELDGEFGNGAETVQVDVDLDAAGNDATGDGTYTSLVLAHGPQGSYRWELEGATDGAAATAEDAYRVTVVAGGTATVLDLETASDAAEIDGTGTLSHDGATVALITLTDSDFAFARPGGGAFSAAQTADLEQLVFVMFLYGPILLFALPFVLF